jgi:hypothetical protein
MDTSMEVFMERKISRRTGKAPSFASGSEELVQEIQRVLTFDLAQLRQKWTALFGESPSPHLGRVLMIRAIAYRMQEKAFGGLKPSTQRILDRLCDGHGKAAQQRGPRMRAGAGTVLIREWRGVRHRVTVLEQDVVYRGRRYKSLSEVARAITGTHWSGPLFFGLKNRTKEAVRG